MANNAKLPDWKTIMQAGIDPTTGAPLRCSSADTYLMQSVSSLIAKNDEQIALNAFQWYGLPKGLTGQLIEKILYYKGQGMLFYMPADETFYFLPYALDGTIDVYGRYTGVTPLPFGGTSGSKDGDKIKPWIAGLKRIPVYDFDPFTSITLDDYENKCILLSDISQTGSEQNITPRSDAIRAVVELEARMLPYMNTALSNATGVSGVRVNSADEVYAVIEASKKMVECAITGEKWVPMLGNLEFQDLSPASVAKAEEFLLSMEAIDNFRLGTFGIENGGLFQKKAQMLQAEQALNGGGGSTGLIMNDRLYQRQTFCLLANNLFGTACWVLPSENIQMQDMNGDGMVGDTQEPMIEGNEGGSEDVEQ